MKKDNRTYIKKLIILLAAAQVFTVPITMIEKPVRTAYADEAKISSLSATYSGDSVLIGEDINKANLTVTATYADGETQEIKDYTIVSTKVTQEGVNLMMVIYQGKTANFYVAGKKINTLTAFYTGLALSIGNSVGKNDVQVYATFSDGSTGYLTNFELKNEEIKSIGSNTVHILCQDQLLKLTVYGVAPKEITALYATYSGGKVTVGSEVKHSDLIITAAYKDGTSEVINNYVLTPKVVGSVGTQTIVANYHGYSVPFNVEGIKKEIKELSAKYIGEPIGVGYSVRPSDVEVTATYNDDTKEIISEFNLLGASITYVGYHVVTAEVGGLKAEFIVQGIEEQKIDFSNSCVFSASNGGNTAKVTIAVPSNVNKSYLSGSEVHAASVRKVLTRVIRKCSYIAFEVEAVNEDVVDEFPLTMKIELPSKYKLAHTKLFYTPNKKSVIGELNTDSVSPNIIVVTIYTPGTYILTYKEDTN